MRQTVSEANKYLRQTVKSVEAGGVATLAQAMEHPGTLQEVHVTTLDAADAEIPAAAGLSEGVKLPTRIETKKLVIVGKFPIATKAEYDALSDAMKDKAVILTVDECPIGSEVKAIECNASGVPVDAHYWIMGLNGWKGGSASTLLPDGSTSFAGPIVAPSLKSPQTPQYFPEMYNPTNSSDWTSAFNTMFAVMQANKGGDVILQPNKTYTCNEVITLPNSGIPETTCPTQYPIRITGGGAAWVGLYPGRAVQRPSTILDLRGVGSHARLLTLGQGILEIKGVQFADLSGAGTNTTPFIKTTNTTLWIHECSFYGDPAAGSGATCATDAIILGDPRGQYGMTADCAFGGYGTRIAQNYFEQIRHGIVANIWAESNLFEYNEWSSTCGGDCNILITVAGTIPGDSDQSHAHNKGNILAFNRYNCTYYQHCVILEGNSDIVAVGNTAWDNLYSNCLSRYRLKRATVNGTVAPQDPSLLASDGHSEADPNGPVTYDAAVVNKNAVVNEGIIWGTQYAKGDRYQWGKIKVYDATGTTLRATIDGGSKNPIQPASDCMMGIPAGPDSSRPNAIYGTGIRLSTTQGCLIYSDGTNWRKAQDNSIA